MPYYPHSVCTGKSLEAPRKEVPPSPLNLINQSLHVHAKAVHSMQCTTLLFKVIRSVGHDMGHCGLPGCSSLAHALNIHLATSPRRSRWQNFLFHFPSPGSLCTMSGPDDIGLPNPIRLDGRYHMCDPSHNPRPSVHLPHTCLGASVSIHNTHTQCITYMMPRLLANRLINSGIHLT